jgi:hypothetical protein
MKSIQSLAAQARREALSAGLPCGEHTYSNRCENQEAYRSIEAMPSAEQIAERQAKREAEKAARMLEAKTLTPAEIQLAIDTLTEARRNSVFNGGNIHWDLIPIISKLERMLND